MGSRGFPPKPTALRDLEGNPGKRPMNDAEPQLPALKHHVPPPTWLRAKAKKVWETVVPVLIEYHVLSEIDLLALSRYCDLWDEWFKSRDVIKKEGSTYGVTDKDGNERFKSRPEFKHYLALNKEILLLEREFGFTPSARSRVRALVGANILPTAPTGQNGTGGNSRSSESADDAAFDYDADE